MGSQPMSQSKYLAELEAEVAEFRRQHARTSAAGAQPELELGTTKPVDDDDKALLAHIEAYGKDAIAEQHAKAKAERVALRRSKQPVSIQIRQLPTKLQIKGTKLEKLTKASMANKVELEKLQEEGQLRALGSGVAKPPDPDSERDSGGHFNLDVLDRILQAAGVSGELVANVKANPSVEQLRLPPRARDDASQDAAPAPKRPRVEDVEIVDEPTSPYFDNSDVGVLRASLEELDFVGELPKDGADLRSMAKKGFQGLHLVPLNITCAQGAGATIDHWIICSSLVTRISQPHVAQLDWKPPRRCAYQSKETAALQVAASGSTELRKWKGIWAEHGLAQFHGPSDFHARGQLSEMSVEFLRPARLKFKETTAADVMQIGIVLQDSASGKSGQRGNVAFTDDAGRWSNQPAGDGISAFLRVRVSVPAELLVAPGDARYKPAAPWAQPSQLARQLPQSTQ
ncbi:unnamed protein product, partial [Prorocentrum cordatum]